MVTEEVLPQYRIQAGFDTPDGYRYSDAPVPDSAPRTVIAHSCALLNRVGNEIGEGESDAVDVTLILREEGGRCENLGKVTLYKKFRPDPSQLSQFGMTVKEVLGEQ